jgi:intracellular multiplication protein IcmM
MSRSTWAQIKLRRYFNVNVYRRGLTVLIGSLLLSVLMTIVIAYMYLNEPERDYYATSGIAPPVKLQPMVTPNMTTQPMLKSDPEMDDEQRVIPQ